MSIANVNVPKPENEKQAEYSIQIRKPDAVLNLKKMPIRRLPSWMWGAVEYTDCISTEG